MNQHLQSILDFLNHNNNLSADEKNSIIKSLKDADKEFAITEFKLDRTEKVKRTTSVLLEETIEELEKKRKDVEAQSKELEIQNALERVRAVALGMKEPADMLEICRTISQQLELLHVKEIRNVQTAIFYEDKSTYMNYEYYAKHNKTFITETTYTNNEIHNAFANQMLKGNGEFFVTHIKGDEVKDWIAYQKTTNVFIDEYLNTASSLNYYWYSLGPVALGISTYEPLKEEETNLFKRFLKVFELSYTRYLDIEQAIAQARESQIQLALERVRARTMAMQKSEELNDVAALLFQQVKDLGIKTWTTGFNVWSDDNNFYTDYVTTPLGNVVKSYTIDATKFSVFTEVSNAKKRGEKFWIQYLEGDLLKEAYKQLMSFDNEEQYKKILRDGFQFPSHQYDHLVFGEKVSLMFITYEAVPEAHEIFIRLGNVFEQTYTRFLDLQKAEAQARESQIQLALERVRARAMAMQTSEELNELISTVFAELTKLDFVLTRCVIQIYEGSEKGCRWWMANSEAPSAPMSFFVKYADLPFFNAYLKGWQERLLKWQYILEGENKIKTDDFLFNETELSLLPDFVIAGMRAPESVYLNASFNNFGNLTLAGLEPLCDEHFDILLRFAKVFDLTYTRFNDLKQAEAQTRESQIQLALERVRARTMAMQKSDELTEAALLLFEQLQSLGAVLWSCGFNIWEKGKTECTSFIARGGKMLPPVKLLLNENPVLQLFNESRQKEEEFWFLELTGEDAKSVFGYVAKQRQLQTGDNVFLSEVTMPSSQITHLVNFTHGNLMFITLEAQPTFHDIFKRFGKVFEQTYTRFLDLQKAEEQARESQIQLALERVRARTMAMQKSDELADTAAILFSQFKNLGYKPDRITIGIMQEEKQILDLWATSGEAGEPRPFYQLPFNEPHVLAKCVKAWKEQKRSLVLDLYGQPLKEYTEFWKSLTATEDARSKVAKVVFNFAFFSKGYLGFISFEHVPPQTIELLERFAGVFDLTYTRFLDLQKAEAQTRESQIQLALERVRARTMAMQKSDELSETVYILFQQFRELGENPDQATIGIINEKESVIEYWVTMYGNQMNKVFRFSIDEPHVTNKIYNAWKKGKKSLVIDLKGKALLEFMAYRAGMGGAAVNPNEKRRIINVAFFSKGLLNVQSNEERSEESVKLLERFASVFEQTYTRFLDLQKAEMQAREAQIEAALERVRSRSLAMHHSEELSEVVNVLFDRMAQLGVVFDSVNINIVNPEAKGFDSWMAAPGQPVPMRLHVSYFDNPVANDLFNAFESGATFFSKIYSREEKNSYFHQLFNLTDFKHLPDERKNMILNAAQWCLAIAIANNTALSLHSYSGHKFSEADYEILKRFSKVFDQAYTRFLDLQKAEAQAREAQIEASLERVRSRTMAMHKSSELIETAELLFDQLKQLGAELQGVAFAICDKNSVMVEKWTSIGVFSHPYTIEPGEQRMYEAWKNGEGFYEEVYEGERQKKYYEAFMEIPAFRQGLQKFIDSGQPIPTWQKNHAVIFKYGYLLFITTKPFKETEVFLRFGKVFEQTYTRFLDLQKAEAQAREAQIEAALERVRSRTMGMQKSEELKEVIRIVYEQLVHLNILVEHAGFIIDYKARDDMNIWLADQHEVPFQVTIPYFDCAHWNSFLEAKENGKDFFTNHLPFEEKNKFYEDLFKLIPGVSGEAKEYYLSCPGLAISTVLLESVGLYIENFSGIPYTDEENNTLMRFGKVFEQTYTRFNDLKKAETNAREAIKQAALDRIRADIASMRTISDLDRITPLIWNELTILGVPFIRCGVFIMSDEQQLIHTFLSTPDGKAIAAFHIPYHTPGNIKHVINHWHNKKNYIDHWDENAFIEFANMLVTQGALTSSKQYLKTIPHGGFYLHFLPFLQGMLYVGNTTQLSEDEINLIQSLADAFSTAYARYEDFNKLEAAKKQVDVTLNELQATQKQLIQSEKMASLGELTAGIAHEIQNPLNFVNNFSEVNIELTNEMNDENDVDELKAIANDIKQNSEKILLHGKRADAIVKNMLQHSRKNSGQKEPTDINALCDEYLRLSYHGLRAKDKSFNADFKTDFDETIGKINVVPQDIGRVLLNLFNNAFYATGERRKAEGGGYVPMVAIVTKKINNAIEIAVSDNGNGIPQKVIEKIFQPFFTTKPTGQGTGLGLSLSYDIVKAHGGEIKVETKEGKGSEFVIQLPIA